MAVNRAQRRGFLIPGLLSLAGIVLLIGTLGGLPADYFAALWRLWPVLILALGLGLLLSSLHPWIGSTAALIPIVGALIAAWPLAELDVMQVDRTLEHFSVERSNASSARVKMNLAGGRLHVGSGTAPNVLAGGSFESCDADSLQVELADRNDRQKVSLSARNHAIGLFGCGRFPEGTAVVWELMLNSRVPISLEIDGGASDARLNLEDLRITQLDINTGASNTNIILPRAAGRTSANFNLGAANLAIEIPDELAARIEIDAGAASFDIDESRFPRVRGHDDRGVLGIGFSRMYESPDFETAVNRVDITIRAGASSISVN